MRIHPNHLCAVHGTHDYQFTGFTWTGNDTDGYTSASAEYVCSRDDDHTQTVAGTIDVHRTEAVCEEDGSIVYTASVSEEDSIDGVEHTDEKTVVLQALGHDYEEPEYTWTERDNGYRVSASTVCRRDPSHVIRETVEAVYSVVKSPTCEGTGTGVYTASFTDDIFSMQTKEETIDALGHDYQFSSFICTGNDNSGYTGASAEYICRHDASHKQTKIAEVSSARTEPACEEDGSVVYTASVSAENSIDGIEHTETKTVVILALGHDYEDPEYTWTETGAGYEVIARTVCLNNSTHVVSETV